MADTLLTRKGFAMLAQALSGKELTFTRVVFGDSKRGNEIVEPTADEQLALTDLISPCDLELPITACIPSDNGTVALTFLINNAHVTTGFYIREVGFFAQVDDVEELYAYANYGLNARWLPASSEETWNVFLTLTITIEQAQFVTAIVDGSLNYVAAVDFHDHIESENPHPNIPRKAENLSTADFLWATASDDNLHKISVQNLAYQILGETSSLTQMNNRLTQTETNLANLFMELKAKDDLGIDPNLMLVEDFTALDTVDNFSVSVSNANQGVTSLEVASLNGLRSGAFYMLSDGIHSELVQVLAVAKSGSQFFVTLAEPLTQSFNDAKLYRSTTAIVDGTARGADDIASKYFEVNESFSGVGANESTTLALNTKLTNVDAFDLSGDWAFDSSGYFTLA